MSAFENSDPMEKVEVQNALRDIPKGANYRITLQLGKSLTLSENYMRVKSQKS